MVNRGTWLSTAGGFFRRLGRNVEAEVDLRQSIASERSALFDRIRSDRRLDDIDVKQDTSQIEVTRRGKTILLADHHWLYAEELCRNFDYYFSSTVPDIRDGQEIVDFSVPGWHVMQKSGERLYFPSWSEDLKSTEDYLEYLRPGEGEIVLDLGAYCGLSTLTFARAVGPSGKVLAFEPDPINFDALQLNLRAAGLTNVVAEQKAVSGTDGSMLFSSEGNMGSVLLPAHADVKQATGEGPVSLGTIRGPAVRVESLTLKSLLERHELKAVDIIKVDIEGSEYELIESSVDVIGDLRARCAIELHWDHMTRTPLNVSRIRSVFDRLDYLTVLQDEASNAAGTSLFAFPRR